MASCRGNEACASVVASLCTQASEAVQAVLHCTGCPGIPCPRPCPGMGAAGAASAGAKGRERCPPSALRRARLPVLACTARQDACWVCLGESTPDEPLTYPCHCPRPVHAPCLARWQLHSAGSRCGARGSPTAALAPTLGACAGWVGRTCALPGARIHALAARVSGSARAWWYLLSSLSGTCTGCGGALGLVPGLSAWLGVWTHYVGAGSSVRGRWLCTPYREGALPATALGAQAGRAAFQGARREASRAFWSPPPG